MREYIERGLIKETVHPDYPELAIYNYTPECQFSKAWDNTTRAARGLVMNRETGDVIAKPWPKFFNLSEHKTIPDGPANVFEKMDGSLGIVFYYDGRWHVSTRGSFTSEQAMYAASLIEGYSFPMGYTHLFEIIYPENRIVVDYDGYEGLVYLESISIETDKPVRLSFWPDKAEFTGVMRPDELPQHKDNAEGYVLYWPEHDFRVKVKFDEYVRLHKVMTEYSIRRLWEHISAGGDFNAMISGVPDEFYREVKIDHEALMTAFGGILSKAQAVHDSAVVLPTRKEQAGYVIRQDKDLSGIVFKMLDGKDVNDAIWRKVREWLNF